MSEKPPELTREQLIHEWMNTNEVFKRLARQFEKKRKLQLVTRPPLDQPTDGAFRPMLAVEGVVLDMEKEYLLSWLGENEAFKRLAKQYGRTYPRPEPKR